MSQRLPTCTAKQVLSALQKAGWYIHHTAGSHHLLRHPDKPGHRVLVAFHSRDLPRPTLRLILNQAGLTGEEFRRLLYSE